MENTVTLKKPIQAHGELVTKLSFREPTCDDIVACGYPLQMGGDTATPLPGPIAKYIARLGGVPPSSVKSMSVQDFSSCMQVILPFFGDVDTNQDPASGA